VAALIPAMIFQALARPAAAVTTARQLSLLSRDNLRLSGTVVRRGLCENMALERLRMCGEGDADAEAEGRCGDPPNPMPPQPRIQPRVFLSTFTPTLTHKNKIENYDKNTIKSKNI
jgi:hypothetical protein